LGSGGGVSPIRVSASRIAPADVRSPSRQSTLRNRFKSVGTAILARGPRFPKEAATQPRTPSSSVFSRDTISLRVASFTFLGSMLRVNSASCLALLVLVVEVSPVRTLAIVSANCTFDTALPVDCAAEHSAQINTSVGSHRRDDPFFTTVVIFVLSHVSVEVLRLYVFDHSR
jgi:hypothetical protein